MQKRKRKKKKNKKKQENKKIHRVLSSQFLLQIH